MFQKGLYVYQNYSSLTPTPLYPLCEKSVVKEMFQ